MSSETVREMTIVNLGTDSEQNEAVYDEWARKGTYEQDTVRWGYALPDRAAALVFKHAPRSTSELSILDAGAGDGLTGVALRKVGFANAVIIGCDISQGMLKKADERKCYDRTKVLDLNRPLSSLESNSFDVVQCIGTLTYISPKSGTLEEFVRITRSGGLICYSNRTDKLEYWKDVETSLAEQWKSVEAVGPIPYLPENPEYAEKVQVVIFAYQVL